MWSPRSFTLSLLWSPGARSGWRASLAFRRLRPPPARGLWLSPPCGARSHPVSLPPAGHARVPADRTRGRVSVWEGEEGDEWGPHIFIARWGAALGVQSAREGEGHSSGSSGHLVSKLLSSPSPFPIRPHRAGCGHPRVCRLLEDQRGSLPAPWACGVAYPKQT